MLFNQTGQNRPNAAILLAPRITVKNYNNREIKRGRPDQNSREKGRQTKVLAEKSSLSPLLLLQLQSSAFGAPRPEKKGARSPLAQIRQDNDYIKRTKMRKVNKTHINGVLSTDNGLIQKN